MKTINLTVRMGFACAILAVLSCLAGAANREEQVLFKDGFVWTVEGGNTLLLKEDIQLPYEISVSTNGTFRVGQHSPRAFAEGQILRADGMLISPDGRIEPVLDHVALDAGGTIVSVNGEISTVNRDIPLGTDKVLTTDRALVGSDRSWMRVIDGQLFTPDGKTIPAVDTISLQDGKVVVQKEGTQLLIGTGRSVMMNDGTKVFGDGRVVSRDGEVTELTEGQVMTIEGVVKLR